MGDEGRGGGGVTDEELTLPRATVQKLITGKSSEAIPMFLGVVGLVRQGVNLRGILTRCTTRSRREDLLPKDMLCTKETRDLIIECCIGSCDPLTLWPL
jgi:hypothetical protein